MTKKQTRMWTIFVYAPGAEPNCFTHATDFIFCKLSPWCSFLDSKGISRFMSLPVLAEEEKP